MAARVGADAVEVAHWDGRIDVQRVRAYVNIVADLG
jgi:hypothetical protein